MHLHFDEDFVEAAVFLPVTSRSAGASALQRLRFNRERERLYSILDPDERNEAFFKLHLEWFREWGMEQLLTEPLGEFPLLAGGLRVLAFRRSLGKGEDGSELYVNEAGDRNGVVSLRPERLLRSSSLTSFLRHELMHLQDMVDPNFGYAAELAVPSRSLSQVRLARERYRSLWDVSIDGRLTLARRQTVATKEQRLAEFERVFSFWTAARREEVFALLWTSPHPTHHALEKLVCDQRQLQSAAGPTPGASCPLCGFPTFVWAAEGSLVASVMSAIGAEFPHWTPEQGACRRCVEVYRLARSQAA